MRFHLESVKWKSRSKFKTIQIHRTETNESLFRNLQGWNRFYLFEIRTVAFLCRQADNSFNFSSERPQWPWNVEFWDTESDYCLLEHLLGPDTNNLLESSRFQWLTFRDAPESRVQQLSSRSKTLSRSLSFKIRHSLKLYSNDSEKVKSTDFFLYLPQGIVRTASE